jgi:hypothetical protein
MGGQKWIKPEQLIKRTFSWKPPFGVKVKVIGLRFRVHSSKVI